MRGILGIRSYGFGYLARCHKATIDLIFGSSQDCGSIALATPIKQVLVLGVYVPQTRRSVLKLSAQGLEVRNYASFLWLASGIGLLIQD